MPAMLVVTVDQTKNTIGYQISEDGQESEVNFLMFVVAFSQLAYSVWKSGEKHVENIVTWKNRSVFQSSVSLGLINYQKHKAELVANDQSSIEETKKD